MGKPMKFVAKDRWILQGNENRRLSWKECAAIQGLPPQTVPSGTLKDKYRVVGNAVPPALGKALLEPVVKYEQAIRSQMQAASPGDLRSEKGGGTISSIGA